MKRLLLATLGLVALGFTVPAGAADLPVWKPGPAPFVVPPIFNWTGCYVGIEGGGNWGRSEQVARAGAFAGSTITGGFDLRGGIAGGTVGCNYQLGSSFVIGIENDISWTDKKGSAVDQAPFNPAALSSTREKWIDTLRGRLGMNFDRVLLYGTGGAAFAGTDVVVSNPAFGSISDSRSRTGWVAGVGGEWAAWTGPWGAVTFKLEYLHADFGGQLYINPSVVTVAGGTVVTRDVRLTDDMVRVGMNLKFDWGWQSPVVAKY
jgi:outer membrane immunogenic protein